MAIILLLSTGVLLSFRILLLFLLWLWRVLIFLRLVLFIGGAISDWNIWINNRSNRSTTGISSFISGRFTSEFNIQTWTLFRRLLRKERTGFDGGILEFNQIPFRKIQITLCVNIQGGRRKFQALD